MDVLYSDELLSFISAKELLDDNRYRVDRCDVDRNVVGYSTLPEQLDFCRSNIIRINAQQPQRGLPQLHTNACGDFQLMSRNYWHLLRGYRESDLAGAWADALLSYASFAAGVREVVLNDQMRIYHIDHDNKWDDRIKKDKLPMENWLSFRIMPSWLNKKLIGLYRILLESLGYNQKSSVHGEPVLSYGEYRKMCKDMIAGRRSYIFNDENWGLGQEILEEFVINAAEWDKDYGKDK